MITTETKPIGQKGLLEWHKLLIGVTVTVLFAATLCGLAIHSVKQFNRTVQQEQSKQNLNRLGEALQKHNDELKYLPAQAIIHPETGEPLLSWRVALLPFLGEGVLFRQIRLDEPWDSVHNRQYWAKMPAVYQLPGKPNDGMTYYQVFHGEKALFNTSLRYKDSQGKLFSRLKYKIHTIPDGSSNTIFAVEGAAPVNWMKPEDIPFDVSADGTSLALLGNLWGDGTCRIVLCSGDARVITGALSPKTLQDAIRPHDYASILGCWCGNPSRCE